MTESAVRQRRRMLMVISAPSGGGKTTLTRALLAADASLGYSVSTTTRPPRPSEVGGQAYHFVSRDEFQRLIRQGQFLEWAEVHGNLYGTRRETVERLLDDGRDVVLDVDIQGARSLRRGGLDSVLVFLAPLSLDVLEERLRGRAQDSEEVIVQRLRAARDELQAAPWFDYVVVNDRFDDALATLRSIIAAERCRALRRFTAGGFEAAGEAAAARAPFAPLIVHASRVMADLLDRAERVARSDSAVLLLGETGTGKEVFAEAIHRASRRGSGPLVRVNCGAIAPTLLESELFGHVAGAFTGAVRDHDGLFRAADGGSIFLDEIGELSLDLQVKLLRVLQDGELRSVGGAQPIHVDVRLMAATNRDLAAAVGEGKFREDLFYRLNVVPLRLPPLRERREDVPDLIGHFLGRLAAAGHPLKAVSPEAMELLLKSDWPGNVRQLENALEHAVVLSRSDTLAPDDFPEAIRRGRAATAPRPAVGPSSDTLRDLEIAAIRRALEQSGNNLTRAARVLAVTRRSLTYRLDKFGIHVERHRGRPKRA